MFKKYPALFITFCIISGFARPALAETVLTLEESLARALQHHLGIQLQRLEVEEALQGLIQEQGKYQLKVVGQLGGRQSRDPTNSRLAGAEVVRQETFLGSVGISADLVSGGHYELRWGNAVTHSNSTFIDPSLNPSFQPDLRLTFQQPLLRNFYVPQQQLEALLIQHQISQAQLHEQVLKTIYRVREAYWLALQSRENLKVARQALERAQVLHQLTDSLVTAGKRPELERLTTQTEVDARSNDVTQTQLARRQADDRLLQLITSQPDDALLRSELALQASDSELAPLPPETEMLLLAQRQRPDYLALEYQLALSQVRIAIAQHMRLPLLTLQSSLSLAGLAGNYLESLHRLVAGGNLGLEAELSLLLPVGNEEGEAAIAIEEIRRAQLLLQQKQLLQQIVFELRDVRHQIAAGTAQLTTLRQAITNAGTSGEIELTRFQQGKATLLEVLERQRTQQRLEQEFLQTLFGLKIQEAQYYQVIGHPKTR